MKKDSDDGAIVIRAGDLSADQVNRIRTFVDEQGVTPRRSLTAEEHQPLPDAERREKLRAAFEDPAGVTAHVFPDRNGRWRARIDLADRSSVYTDLSHTAMGAFTALGELAWLIRGTMQYEQVQPDVFVVTGKPDAEAVRRSLDSEEEDRHRGEW